MSSPSTEPVDCAQIATAGFWFLLAGETAFDSVDLLPQFQIEITGTDCVRRSVFLKGLISAAVLLVSAGCSIMPIPGRKIASSRAGTRSGPEYGLVKLTPTVTNILKEYGPGALAASFPATGVPPLNQVWHRRRCRRHDL